MITTGNIWQQWVDLANNFVFFCANSGVPVNGTSGTGAGICGPGSTIANYASGQIYFNSNTKASPLWLPLTINNTAIFGNAPIAQAKAQYDFSVDGGAVGLITPASNVTIPSKAIIIGGVIDVLTTFTSSGSATVSIGTSAGSSAASLKAATAFGSYAAGLVAVVPLFTAASMVKLSAAGAITLTVGTAALTAGKANIIVQYIMSN